MKARNTNARQHELVRTLVARREALGISQQQAATRMGIRPAVLSRQEIRARRGADDDDGYRVGWLLDYAALVGLDLQLTLPTGDLPPAHVAVPEEARRTQQLRKTQQRGVAAIRAKHQARVREARRLADLGKSHEEIAAELEITVGTVGKYLAGNRH